MFRTAGEGEALIQQGNAFVARVLPNGMLRKLSDEEMSSYRTPFPDPESIILYSVPGRDAVYETFGFRRMTTAMAIFEDPEAAFAKGYISRP
jgi:hypothetical protein